MSMVDFRLRFAYSGSVASSHPWWQERDWMAGNRWNEVLNTLQGRGTAHLEDGSQVGADYRFVVRQVM
jgi:hypothetical protein